MNEPTREIVIKFNNLAVDTPCAICDAWIESDVGPELFLEGTWDIVCRDCGKARASWMVKWVERLEEVEWAHLSDEEGAEST